MHVMGKRIMNNAKKTSTSKNKTLYQIRYYGKPGTPQFMESRPIGFKGRLLSKRKAAAICGRLCKGGIDAFIVGVHCRL